MAGDISHAKQIVRRFCKNDPSCVTVTATTYVYAGGAEEGFVVAFRNYPRFPSVSGSLAAKADLLAEMLRKELAQNSSMVVSESGTTWSADRNE